MNRALLELVFRFVSIALRAGPHPVDWDALLADERAIQEGITRVAVDIVRGMTLAEIEKRLAEVTT